MDKIKEIKKKFFFTWLRLKALDFLKLGADNGIRRMGPYRVSVLSFGDFEYLFRHIFWKMEYYFESENPAPFILDCGSNIGVSVLFFKTLFPAATIKAFEPSPGAFACLQANILQNSLENVSAHNLALAGEAGDLELFVPPENQGHLCTSSAAGRTPGGKAIRVEAVTLSPFVDRPVDLVKMDIEGPETQVLAEMEQAGSLNMVSRLIVEYHHHLTPGDDGLSQILGILERNGFGYHIDSPPKLLYLPGTFQDIMIRAYKRRGDSK
jgi:FkbM family methyltransferase